MQMDHDPSTSSAYRDYVVTWLGDLMKKLYYLSLWWVTSCPTTSVLTVFTGLGFFEVSSWKHMLMKNLLESATSYLYIYLFNGLRHQGAGIVMGWKLKINQGDKGDKWPMSGWWVGDEWVMSGQWVGSERAMSGWWSGDYFKLHAELKIGTLII